MLRIMTLIALAILLPGAAASAQVPELISHQGKLFDAGGNPVPDGTYLMEFRFYDACSGGNLLLTDTHTVETGNGIYSLFLGGGTLTAGVESSLLGVFENHDLICLGTKVGSDAEMQPRQQIASSGFAMRVASAAGLDRIDVKQGNGVYYCDADWDDDGTPSESADVVACLASALDAIETNEDGQDNAITVKLPSGRFDVSGACSDGTCFELKSGIHIVGEMPRLRHLPGLAPDLYMQPNGGTWLDPGPSNVLFTGQHLRGVVLERFGVTNFGQVAVLGGDEEDGIAFSTIRDVYAVGTSELANPRSTDAWVFHNIQHLSMDHVKVYNVERGLHVIAQNFDWQPANSVISDFYVYTYPDPPGGILIETVESSAGDSWMMNYITLIRPQVNAFSSSNAPGTSGIWLRGFSPSRPVRTVRIVAADVEGEYDVAIRLDSADHNHIEVAGVTSPTTGIRLDAESSFNIIVSSHDRLTVDVATDKRNMFIGQFDSTDETVMRGLYYDRITNRWLTALGYGGLVSSGSGNLWYDDDGNRWRVSEGAPSSLSDGQPIVTGTGAAASQGPAIWVDAGKSCQAACLDAGMANCFDAWSGGATVGCATTTDTRICACR